MRSRVAIGSLPRGHAAYQGSRRPLEIKNIQEYNKTYEYILSCFIGIVALMSLTILDEHNSAHVAELFRAFSDKSRVRILSALLDGEKNVSALTGLLGITESAVSHHMRGLRQIHIVNARREGQEVFYSTTDPHIIALFKQGVKHVRDD